MQGMRMRPIVTDVPRSLVYAHWCRTVQNRMNRSICSLGQGLAGNRALDEGRDFVRTGTLLGRHGQAYFTSGRFTQRYSQVGISDATFRGGYRINNDSNKVFI